MRFSSLISALDAAPAERRFITAWFDEDEENTVSFGEFRQRCWPQARILQQYGVRDGEHVILVMPQSSEETVSGHATVRGSRVIACGSYNEELGTGDAVVVAEIREQELETE